MATGRGRSLGAALIDLYEQLSGQRRRTSYTASGWHAQLRALTSTRAGRAAADQVGLSPTGRTLLAWLAEQQTPNTANRAKIADAYRLLQGGFNRAAVQKEIQIKGQVTFVSANGRRDSRNRGANGTNPLRVDGAGGDWDEIEREWNAGNHGAGQHEDLFVNNVVEPDIGEVSEGSWGSAFDGTWYEVTV